ncbi:MAG: inositol monophosphatase [Thermoplasmata archaeon]|nr:inositol monophosphatase [Thermoplasmata archaeon]
MTRKWPLREMALAVEGVMAEHSSEHGAFDSIGMGADGTETLRIDQLAETAILDIVDTIPGGLNVLSEEIGWVDKGARHTLVVDPIDGTYNASVGIPFYSVCLAIGNRTFSDVEEAMVYNLVSGDSYHAVKGQGATMNGRTIRTRPYKEEDSLYVLYSGNTASDRAHELTKRPRRVRALGSAALEMCLVAQGCADLFFQDGYPLRITDLAAPGLIVREAGGELFTSACEMLEMRISLEDRKEILAVGDASALDRLYLAAMNEACDTGGS